MAEEVSKARIKRYAILRVLYDKDMIWNEIVDATGFDKVEIITPMRKLLVFKDVYNKS